MYAQGQRNHRRQPTLTRIGRDLGSRAAFVVGLLGAASVLGCGAPPTGTISGTVTCNSEPVTLGTIAFHGADGRVVSGTINTGRYLVMNAPVGAATLTVQAHALPPQMGFPGQAPPATEGAATARPAGISAAPSIPPQYADRATSELNYEIKPGEQQHDVTLRAEASGRK